MIEDYSNGKTDNVYVLNMEDTQRYECRRNRPVSCLMEMSAVAYIRQCLEKIRYDRDDWD